MKLHHWWSVTLCDSRHKCLTPRLTSSTLRTSIQRTTCRTTWRMYKASASYPRLETKHLSSGCNRDECAQLSRINRKSDLGLRIMTVHWLPGEGGAAGGAVTNRENDARCCCVKRGRNSCEPSAIWLLAVSLNGWSFAPLLSCTQYCYENNGHGHPSFFSGIGRFDFVLIVEIEGFLFFVSNRKRKENCVKKEKRLCCNLFERFFLFSLRFDGEMRRNNDDTRGDVCNCLNREIL